MERAGALVDAAGAFELRIAGDKFDDVNPLLDLVGDAADHAVLGSPPERSPRAAKAEQAHYTGRRGGCQRDWQEGPTGRVFDPFGLVRQNSV
jgi:hypothetical protein